MYTKLTVILRHNVTHSKLIKHRMKCSIAVSSEQDIEVFVHAGWRREREKSKLFMVILR